MHLLHCNFAVSDWQAEQIILLFNLVSFFSSFGFSNTSISGTIWLIFAFYNLFKFWAASMEILFGLFDWCGLPS